VGKTAVGVMKDIGQASSNREAVKKWTKCRTSSLPECKKLQDDMCASYSNYIQKALKRRGIPVTPRNMYLAWNQGPGGAAIILKAADNNEEVTHPKIAGHMKNQAWNKTANAKDFLKGLEEHMHKKGVAP
jgi:hypothetical protein